MPNRLARRVAVVGWDAADWRLIHPLLDAGNLPNLQRLIETGVMGDLAPLELCVAPISWTSVATGKTPDRHGVCGLVEPDPAGGRCRPVASTSRRGKALWNICHQAGYNSLVVNWFATHPAEPIRGAIVSKEFPRMTAPVGAPWPVPQGAVYPAGLEPELAALRLHLGELTGAELLPFLPELARIDQDHDQRPVRLAEILAENITVQAVATWLMENREWDLLAVHFDATRRAAEIDRDALNGVYRFQDMMLGRIAELAGPEAAVLVLSDCSGQRQPRLVAPSHLALDEVFQEQAPNGIFCMAGPGIRSDELVFGAGLLDIAPTVLSLLGIPAGADMRGRILVEAFWEPVEQERIPSWDAVDGECGMHPEGARSEVWDSVASIKQLADLGYVDPVDANSRREIDLARIHQDFNLARYLLGANRAAEALPLLERLVGMKPEDVLFQLYLAQSYFLVGRVQECRSVAERVLEKVSNESLAALLRANLDLAEGKLEEGLEQLLAIDRSSQPESGLRHAIGRVYLKLKRWQEAERSFRSVLELSPGHAHASAGLAQALLELGDAQGAAEAAADAVALRFDLSAGHFLLGTALAKLGRTERAMQAFRTFLAQKPGVAAAEQWLARLENQACRPVTS